MRYDAEISRDAKHWKAATLYSVLPLPHNTKYIIAVRNIIVNAFSELRLAKRQKRKMQNELKKLGVVLELAGFSFRIFCIRIPEKPAFEKNAIDVDYEVMR